MFLLWVALRLGFRILGRDRRRDLFNRLGWRNLGVFQKQLYSRFPITAKYDLTTELTEERVILNLSGDLFVDVGAHVGYMSLMARRQFKKVIAIEPHPSNFAILKDAIQKVNATNIQALQLAVSDSSKDKIPLFIGNSTGTHSLLHNFAGGDHGFSGVWKAEKSSKTMATKGDTIYVETITLGDLLASESHIDLIKVDVEGAEWAVLRGAESIVDRVKTWIVEIHFRDEQEREAAKQKIMNWLHERGYNIRWIDYKRIFGWS
jgi:FkbM family methyltransferase